MTDVRSRLAKLRALAAGRANEHEASLAAEMADRLERRLAAEDAGLVREVVFEVALAGRLLFRRVLRVTRTLLF